MSIVGLVGTVLAAATAHAEMMPVAIIAGTFILEDAATILAAILASEGYISAPMALVSLYLGVVLGDLGLYALGRLAVTHPWAKRFAARQDVAAVGGWLHGRLIGAVLTVRFVPGMRFPAYTASGFFRVPFGRFALAAIGATLIWTSLLFAAAYTFGAASAALLGKWRWPVAFGAVALLVVLPHLVRRLRPEITGERPVSRFEFAPGWLFYFPVGVYWTWLSIRHRSLALPTLANPTIAAGGLCGESKTEVLRLLGPEGRARLAPFVAVDRGEEDSFRVLRRAVNALAAAGIGLPVVAKPDIGRRGNGVVPIHDLGQLAAYVERFPRGRHLILQKLAPGDREAGVFYVRWPGEQRGRILSLTLKRFPEVVGDGHATVRELILRDPRAGRIPHLYLPRLEGHLGRVLEAGERFRLVFTGNHCKGAIFEDGRGHITEALRARFDAIAREMPGFHYGRFDVRYHSLEALRRGEGFTIIEVNGTGSEATHIWDRRTTFKEAYRSLFEQVRIAFEIGAEFRRRGLKPMNGIALLRRFLAERRLMGTYPNHEAAGFAGWAKAAAAEREAATGSGRIRRAGR